LVTDLGSDKNFTVVQGDNFAFELSFQYVDPSSSNPQQPNYLPIDLTGFTFLMEIKDKPQGKTLIATASVNDGITVLDYANGKLLINISSEKTKKLAFPRSHYQIKRTDQYGNVDTIVRGWIIVEARDI
jgi:hypothetical protein